MNYDEYLQTPYWLNEVKEPALRRAGYQCERCGRHSHLDVHHKDGHYNWWHETEDDVEVLCRHCHELAHSTRELAKVSLANLKAMQLWGTTRFGVGFGDNFDVDEQIYIEELERNGLASDYLRALELPFGPPEVPGPPVPPPPQRRRGYDTA
jgi:hypothetical protein